MAMIAAISPGGRGPAPAGPTPGLCLMLLLLLTLLATCAHSLPLPSQTGYIEDELALPDLEKKPQVVDELWLQPVLVRRLDSPLGEAKENTPIQNLLNVGKMVARLRRAMGANRTNRKKPNSNESRESSVDARNARSGWDRSGWGGGYGK